MNQSTLSIEQILDNCISAMQSQSLTAEQCLHRYPEVSDELAPLLRLTERISSYQSEKAPTEFRNNAALRMRNLIESRPHPVAAGPNPSHRSSLAPFVGLREVLGRALVPRRSWSSARVLLVAMALFLATVTGVTYAADQALPGNTFYPVKTAVEGVTLALAGGEAQTLSLHLRYAERRLHEAETLAMRSQREEMQAALTAYQEHLNAIVAMIDSYETWRLPGDSQLPADVDLRLADLETRLARLLDRPELADLEDLASALTVSHASRQHIADILRSIRHGDEGRPRPGVLPGLIVGTATSSPVQTVAATPTPTTTPSPTPVLVVPKPSPNPRPPLVIPPLRPTDMPGRLPTILPTLVATLLPSDVPTARPTRLPPARPTWLPTDWPTTWPSDWPTDWPTAWPTDWPYPLPTGWPTVRPPGLPGELPTLPPRPSLPTERPTRRP